MTFYTQYRRYRTGTNGVEEELPVGELRKTDAGLRGQSKFTEEDAQAWISRWNHQGKPIWRYELVEPVPQRDEAL